ncbi:MAG TPA: sodium:alanine symporter family protein [Ruminococcaceae bacterium]|nr:sodium:alanine symporter family protein [Oscillospiraceae bacterium]
MMNQFLDGIASVNDKVNSFVWGKVGLILLISTGILLTVLTKVFQVSHIGHWWKNTIGSIFKKDVIGHSKDGRSISPFQALCTALAATVGTGNIAGVAAAICAGGAGAVFWMWIAAFFGMMTNFSENVLGIFYRRRNQNGEWSGGAMYYLRDGLGAKKGCGWIGKILAVLFSLFAILASFGIGSMGQVNKIVLNIKSAFEIRTLEDTKVFGSVSLYAVIIGLVLVALASLIILGGLRRIAAFAEKVIPFMVVAYVLGALVIIGKNYSRILPAFGAIFKNAFTPIAAIGGVSGYMLKTVIDKTMTQGFKRGVFSNEAGLGSSVMVHSNSNVKEPVKQGMWGIFEVFADTIVVCTITALVVLTSGVYNLSTGVAAGEDATLVASAFNSVFSFGNIGERFVAIAMLLFAFTTVIGWSHYGTKAWEYLFGTKSTVVFKVIHIATIMLGAIMTSSLAWDISDTFNGLMMMPNLVGVVALSPLVMKITKNYIDRRIRKKDVKPILSYDADIQSEAEAHIDD